MGDAVVILSPLEGAMGTLLIYLWNGGLTHAAVMPPRATALPPGVVNNQQHAPPSAVCCLQLFSLASKLPAYATPLSVLLQFRSDRAYVVPPNCARFQHADPAAGYPRCCGRASPCK